MIRRPECNYRLHTSAATAPNALARPRSQRSSYGLGLKDFVRINTLHTAGFVGTDDVLVLRAVVTADADGRAQAASAEPWSRDPLEGPFGIDD